MGQQITKDVSCCRNEEGSRNCELQLWELSDHPSAPHSLVQIHGCSVDPPEMPDPEDFDCCKAHDEHLGPAFGQSLETLNYTPIRFDAKSTVDMERSGARYQKIVVHSSRARTQRRSKAWEEWIRLAAAGRSVTLLLGAGVCRNASSNEDLPTEWQKVEAAYYLDQGLTKISILPQGDSDGFRSLPSITILVDNIQVVCGLTEFMLLSEAMESQLDESERARAALVQYLAEDNTSQRVCFLEENESTKDRCVQALTALWLEKRNDHSMWF